MSAPEKETDALGRRIWDKEAFKLKAEERAREDAASDEPKPYVKPVQRENLRQREYKVDVGASVGKTRLISSVRDKNGGYHCDVCDCILRDSMTYLDHINGKKHQRNLGMSMRVENVGVDAVKAKLAAKKRARALAKQGPQVYDHEASMARALDAEEEEKQRRRAAKKRRKLEAKKAAKDDAALRVGDDDVDAAVDPDMAAMMGFGGFGGKK